ncbi:succinylglutamic semialdehyde dehydrogenase [Phenylobacterium haematophilum]|uniref:Succinylglutamic semialdehyde dehydrogenase n=1 Tax=Phenylobacterium haematophilum TaxID=98513 RepID=A0A840A8A1_9CAUL|nr:succinylglutamate-semialdehyde dehydrogenase [Phenylobacterium haematophilum]MBB3893552.1 succinylglutamic semialdehyde dehydrogenase [Phenylobacterium haematophilum]
MSNSEIVSTDPCTGEVVWRGPAADPAALDGVMARARTGFEAWSRRPLEERHAVARAFAELAKARREEIARLLSQETGKPFWETLTEADTVAGKVEVSIRAQAERAGERSSEVAGGQARLAHRPHGVLAVIGPFNFPMHLPNGHIAPALIAGNAVVFKPSEKTPASGLLLAHLWREAGVPDEVLQVVIGAAEAAKALVVHEGIDGVLFTGGVAAGRAIHIALADQPQKIVALELGGNNPLVVWDVADAESAAHLIVQSAYVSAGQRCSCARRLIVPQGAAGERVVEALGALIDRIVVGAPFDEPQPFMGPVIDMASAQHLLDAQAQLGGRAIRKLRRIEDSKPFLTPGLVDVTGVAAPDVENFGPLLQVIRAADWESAIAAANATRFGLAAGLLSDDEARYRDFWSRARAGIVNWNRPTTGAAATAPFGGPGLSGNHRPSAYYAADYCAYPVASMEAGRADFRIVTGLAP